MNQIVNIKHPLVVGDRIRANRPVCPCKGGGTTPVVGAIQKVITNHTGNWYYLNTGVTVQDKWVTEILQSTKGK
jgi:hypothetical protein